MPLLLFVRLPNWWDERKNPLKPRASGDPEFDRFYVIEALSDGVARAAFGLNFRSHLLARPFRGLLEVRLGLLLASPAGVGCDAELGTAAQGAEDLLGAATQGSARRS